MIFSLNKQTLQKDLQSFLSLTADRQARFDAAPEMFPSVPPRVNLQQRRLHPERMTLRFCGSITSPNGLLFCDFRSDDGPLPPFCPGQQARVFCGAVSHPLLLASAPEEAAEGVYRFGVSAEKQQDAYAFFERLSVGSSVEMRAPAGSFRYLSLRDGNSIVLVVDSAGLSAACSFAAAFPPDGQINIAFYTINCVRESFFDERFHQVDSPEALGRPAQDAPLFVCGSSSLCNYLQPVSAFVSARFLPIGALVRSEPLHRIFTCAVQTVKGTCVVPCGSDSPLLSSLEEAGIRVPVSCADGECGCCRMRLLSGSVTFYDSPDRDPRRRADAERSVIHACRVFPDSDLTVSF